MKPKKILSKNQEVGLSFPISLEMQIDCIRFMLKSEEGCQVLVKNCLSGPGPVEEHQDYLFIMNLLSEDAETLARFAKVFNLTLQEKIRCTLAKIRELENHEGS